MKVPNPKGSGASKIVFVRMPVKLFDDLIPIAERVGAGVPGFGVSSLIRLIVETAVKDGITLADEEKPAAGKSRRATQESAVA